MTASIRIPTFDADIILIHDVGRDCVKRYAQRKFGCQIEKLYDEFSGLTVDADNMTWIVYIPDTQLGDFVWLVKTLSHEANHVTLQMMRKIGVQDDETMCYCQDNLLGEMLKKVMKRRKPPRKQ